MDNYLVNQQQIEKLAQSIRQNMNKLDCIGPFFPGSFYWKDKKGRYLGGSDLFLKSLHLSLEQLVGRTDEELWPEQASTIKEHDKKVLEENSPITVEETLTPAAGATKVFLTVKMPLADNDNNLIGIVANTVDITAQKMYEMELKNAKEKSERERASVALYLENILNCSPGNLYWKDRSGIYLGCNDFMVKVSHARSQSDIIGKTDEMLWPHYAKSIKANDLMVLETGKVISIEEKVGDQIYFSTKKPLYDERNNIIGLIGYSIDITHIKKVQAELIQAKEQAEMANKAKTEFLENMRHDIRTPITGIIGFANIIKNEAQEQKIRDYVDNLIISSKALLDFLNEILESIRVFSGTLPLLQKKFNVREVLKQVLKLNQAKAKEKGLDLKFTCEDTIPQYLIGDPIRIYRIIHELTANALNFTDKGYIHISAKIAGKENRNIIIKIIVEDTGIGISPDKQEDIFIRFKRLNPSSQGIYKGAGLGLTIIKQFIDDLSGELYVESEPEKGSKFSCLLPLREALIHEEFGSETAEKIARTAAPSTTLTRTFIYPVIQNKEVLPGQNRILLVEDQPLAAEVTKIILSDLNCHVDVAANAKAAIEKSSKTIYDLIFMDLGLSDLDGYEATRRIRSNELTKDRRVPIVALTAHADNQDKERCIESGMNAIYIKPLFKEKARDIINAFIPKSQETRIPVAANDNIDWSILPDKTIDLDLGSRLFNGNVELAKKMISSMIVSFSAELEGLEQAYKTKEWKVIENIIHKLRGDVSYCGTPRLQEACARLENHLKAGHQELAPLLYKQLLKEVEAVKNAHTELL